MANELKMPEEMYREIFKESGKSRKATPKKVKLDFSKFKKLVLVMISKKFIFSVLFILLSIFLIFFDVNIIKRIVFSEQLKLTENNEILPPDFRLYLTDFREGLYPYISIETTLDVNDFVFKNYANSMEFGDEYLQFDCNSTRCTAVTSCTANITLPIFSNLNYNTTVYYNNNVVFEYPSSGVESGIVYKEVNITC